MLTVGGESGRRAAVGHGVGIAPGTFIVGVSVVAVRETGTENLSHLSTSFHDQDINAAIDAALAYMGTLGEKVAEYLDRCRPFDVAHRLGHEAGVAAGTWIIDGRTTERSAQRIITGIENGDPRILDRLPNMPLSGEWADGLSADDVIRDVEAEAEVAVSDEERDDVLSAFEDGFHQGVEAEVTRSAMALVGEAVR